jgi:hypothetical protein|nr:MAG TPA: hypothetical protein [Caudoviricetes sp.]
MNKEELIKEYDEKAKALRDEFISKLEDDKKEFKLTYPENKEIVYFFDGDDGEIYDTKYYVNDTGDKNMFEHGLYFNTEKEAEQFLKERKLLFKLHQWAKLKNEGWEPDWGDVSQHKYSIEYSGLLDKLWVADSTVQNRISKLPYFKTRKIAQECINLFGEEIKEVLC